jgi:hypothetical protein
MKTRVMLAVCLLMAGISSAFAQISNVIPGADNTAAPGCGATGVTVPGIGNPPPSFRLSKPCATALGAFAFADIVSTLEGGPAAALLTAGFDIQNGTHCGAGSPRFVLDLDAESFFVNALGCQSGTAVDLGNGWTRITFSTAQIQAAVVTAGGNPASIITDMFVLFDEGNDTPANPPLIVTPGTAVIDNLMVNGVFFGGTAIAGVERSVPVLDDFALVLLAALMGVTGVFLLSRR